MNMRYAASARLTAEGFWFARDRDRAVFQSVVGPEKRNAFGARASGTVDAIDYAVQASLQRGTIGSKQIRAYGFAADIGYTIVSPTQPRFGVSFGYASGDRNRNDAKLETFDPLYPNLGYFTDAPLAYPSNSFDIHPNVALDLVPSLRATFGTDFLFRVTRSDAIYATPGIPVINGNGQGGKYVAALSYAKLAWRISPMADVSASYTHGSRSEFIRERGGRNLSYGVVVLTLRW
jgi:hypothetical protein